MFKRNRSNAHSETRDKFVEGILIKQIRLRNISQFLQLC